MAKKCEKSSGEKTSVFRGVHWSQQKKRWICQVRAAGIQKICSSEVEAAAHYNVVAQKKWGREVGLNDPWLVRPQESHVGSGRFLQRILEIDKHHYLELDEDTYRTIKDNFWFIDGKTGFVRCVYDVNLETKGFWYQDLHTWLFGGQCYHRNEDLLDNRRSNLISPDKFALEWHSRRAKAYEPSPSLNSPEVLNGLRQLQLDPVVQEYGSQRSEYLAWLQGVTNQTSWLGAVPRDPGPEINLDFLTRLLGERRALRWMRGQL